MAKKDDETVDLDAYRAELRRHPDLVTIDRSTREMQDARRTRTLTGRSTQHLAMPKEKKVTLDGPERAFVKFYLKGNSPRDAALKAGISPRIAEVWGEEMLQRKNIVQAIAQMTHDKPDEKKINKLINSRDERRRWLASLTLDESAEMRYRIKAIELLGRTHGDFVDRIETTGKSLEDLVMESLKMTAIDVTPQTLELDEGEGDE